MSNSFVISHRGANKYAPQNTLHAFEKAIEIGCEGFETDVHITKDGKIVLCHNYTIDETSNGTGLIADKTLDELKSYDFGSYFNKRFAGTKIPTIDEFLSFVETTDISVLNIEIKSPKENETAIVKETIKAVKEHGLFDKLLISSFDPKLLVEAKEIDKNCKTGFLYAPNRLITYTMLLWPIKFAKKIGCDALHPQCLYVNPAYVKAAHKEGLLVNPWTVDTEFFINKMIDFSADGIITNYPDMTGGLIQARK